MARTASRAFWCNLDLPLYLSGIRLRPILHSDALAGIVATANKKPAGVV